MWYNLYLLVSMLMSFFDTTSISMRIINQSMFTLDRNGEILENSRETINLPTSIIRHFPDFRHFSKFTKTVSEKKCMEYVYEMLKRQENDNLGHSDSKDVTIINGKVVKEAEYPHMGALGWWSATEENMKLVFLCGASLISDRFMLTAAHCTYSTRRDLVQHEPYLVRLGSRYLEQSPHEMPKDVIISKLRNHPNYVPLHHFFDIALVELEEKIAFSKFIQPACLPSRRNYLGSGKKILTATGWGSVNARKRGYAPSKELRSAEVHVFDKDTCNSLLNRFRYRFWMGIEPHQMCAGELDGNADTCQGDSGGPLQYALVNTTSEGTIHRILSVTSFGLTDCAVANAPGVYTDISYYNIIEWIELNVWPYEKKERKNGFQKAVPPIRVHHHHN